MAQNSFDPERRARELEEIARGCSHEANRPNLGRIAERLRRKVHALADGTRVRLGEPMVNDRTSRIWWATLLRAGAAIVFGLVTLVWPKHSAQAVMALFGAYAVFDGLAVCLVAANAGRRRLRLMVGAIINLVAGLMALTQPRIFALLLVRVLGGWLLLRSLAEIFSDPSRRSAAEAESMSAKGRHRWVILNAAMSALFGAGLIAAPRIGALGLMWAIGAWAVLHGLLMAPFALSLRRKGPPADLA